MSIKLAFFLQEGESEWRDIARRVSQLMPLSEQAEIEAALRAGLFYPGTPILRNAGSRGPLNMLSCHSWQVGNSIEEIMEAATVAAIVFKSGGGGLGLDLSLLQPSSDPLKYITRPVDVVEFGRAGGPLGFWPLFMMVSGVIGKWRSGKPSGSMGTLNWSHPDARRWASCKREDGQFNESNLTVTVDDWNALSLADREFISENAWHNGTPGVAFLDNINARNPALDLCGRMTTLNVCVTGETLVAVADGRDAISIEQLAREGNDFSVYSQGKNGIEIQRAYNPHKTQSMVPVVRVDFSDGSFIRCTPNHRLMLRSGKYQEAQNLSSGDSIMPFYKYQYQNSSQIYWAIHSNEPGNNVGWSPEHRLVAEYMTGKRLKRPSVVHHIDYNGLNNRQSNLRVMSHQEHVDLHRDKMLGDSNPMRDGWWNGLSDKEKQVHRDKVSAAVSGSNNPMYGKHHSDKTKALIRDKAILRCTPEMRKAQSDTMKAYYEKHGTDMLRRELAPRTSVECGHCGITIRLLRSKYEEKIRLSKSGKVYCSLNCGARGSASLRRKITFNDEAIVGFGIQFYKDMGELPTQNLWDEWRDGRSEVCSRETIRRRMGFRTLQDAINIHNHKVVSVKADGYADVYDVTVENTHNLAYVLNPNDTTPKGNLRLSGIVTSNCSEVPGWHATTCALSSLVLPAVVKKLGDWDELRRVMRLQVRLLDRILDVNHYPHRDFQQQAQLVRQIGAGTMGWADLLRREGIAYASETCNELAHEIGRVMSETAEAVSWELARERGGYAPEQPRNVFRMALAPNGHIARLAGVSPSICLDFNDPVQYGESLRLSPAQHVCHLAIWAAYIDGGISYTLPLRNECEPGEVREAFDLAHHLGVKSLSVYRDGSREGQPCNVDGTCVV